MTPSPEVVAAAQAAQKTWNIPASVSIAQFALESGWGARLPPGSNNPFGIKAVAGQAAVTVETHEFLHGHMVEEPQPFAKFATLAAAFDAHAQLLATHATYAPARAKLPDLAAFCAALGGGTPQHPTYATDPDYGAKLMAIIRGNDLTKYDVAAVP